MTTTGMFDAGPGTGAPDFALPLELDVDLAGTPRPAGAVPHARAGRRLPVRPGARRDPPAADQATGGRVGPPVPSLPARGRGASAADGSWTRLARPPPHRPQPEAVDRVGARPHPRPPAGVGRRRLRGHDHPRRALRGAGAGGVPDHPVAQQLQRRAVLPPRPGRGERHRDLVPVGHRRQHLRPGSRRHRQAQQGPIPTTRHVIPPVGPLPPMRRPHRGPFLPSTCSEPPQLGPGRALCDADPPWAGNPC